MTWWGGEEIWGGKNGERIKLMCGRMAWNRTPAVDFDGTVTEWNNGRKEKVMRAYGVRRGIVKEDSKPASSSDRNDNTGVSSPQGTFLTSSSC